MDARVNQLFRSFRALAAVLLASAAPGSAAQNTDAARPLPGLDDYTLPPSRSTPRASPTPEPTISPRGPRPAPTLTPTPPAQAPLVPTIRATPTSRPVPRPSAPPRAKPLVPATPPPPPAATASPLAQPSVAVVPEPGPPLAPPPAITDRAVPAGLDRWTMSALGGALLLLALAATGWWRWRAAPRSNASREIFLLDTDDRAAAPAAPPVAGAPLPDPSVDPLARARLEFDLVLRRAGTNLLSAAVEYTIVASNTGDAAATGIRLDVRLLSAGPREDAEVAALFAAPVDASITAPFDLPSAGAVELGGMAMHPKETLEVMEAAGRALFVPVLTVDLRYAWHGGSGQTARSYVIGLDRGGGAKLQPFRLDTAARMYETVAALPYTIAVTV